MAPARAMGDSWRRRLLNAAQHAPLARGLPLHGLMRREALAALRGSDLIIHAGDVGRVDIIDQLSAIAPAFAVRGNVDTQSWARALPDTRVVEAGQLRFYVLHCAPSLRSIRSGAGSRR